ncbi:MAG: SDR family oxidoreductase [Prevotella sp.]|jgi:short-subunit dehydrogenase|nr:SDR family oxidoreductase [Prevotella sp.]MCH4183807.1 SDR family oxidoreductase [Prevotella sp.]
MTNRYVLITGASAGIGKALAEEFAKNGHNVMLVARSEDKLRILRDQLQQNYKVLVEYMPLDVTGSESPERILRDIENNGILVDCFINNAGMGDACLFEKTEWDKDEKIVELNILALMKMNRLSIPYMKKNGDGTIVNIASTLAFAPTAGEAVYAASKAFVLSFSQALYEETKGSGVSVLTICPGVTNTDFFSSAGFDIRQFKAATPESFAKFAYKQIKHQKPLSVHRFSNKAISVFARLAPRGTVRRAYANFCKTK